ncbi:MAG TPA: beta-L-arabinofuranosidase domain-containing protein [Levilinea sp.]|nr:beta-L-arabinofuranosidase domain-containing protein [Levilinea sp.]
MNDQRTELGGPVDNSSSSHSALRTLPYRAVHINDGFWAKRQKTNRQASLKHGYVMLEKAGNFNNLRIAAGWSTGRHAGRNFSDESVYKWLEALGWELGVNPDEELQRMADEIIQVVCAVQQPDGYLNSYYQTAEPEMKWKDLDFGHELYCAGHLFQAATAFYRALGDDRLLQASLRFVDHIQSVFGPGKIERSCGHPEVEMALVELYRLTGQAACLRLAKFFVDVHGRREMKGFGPNGPEYHQDHLPVRQANEVTGHAVRQMYLATAVADLYMETGEQALFDTSLHLWKDMTGTKMYITGGIGSRYDGESFGDSYELPPDQCYCETCAAIGSLMWNWRMLLISGESRYADLIEQTLYNGILSSPALDGRHFFYVNPLMLRRAASFRQSTNPSTGAVANGRREWHEVPCCPPNVMRLFASLNHYLATMDTGGIQIHQYASADIDVDLEPGKHVHIQTVTDYPWQGAVHLGIFESTELPWKLHLRLPAWCQTGKRARVHFNDEVDTTYEVERGYIVIERTWRKGDVVRLEFPMKPELIQSNPRVDATRSCLAIRRGPLVYCLEQHDQEGSLSLLDMTIDPHAPLVERWDEMLGGLMVIEAAGYCVDVVPWGNQLYQPILSASNASEKRIRLAALPYYAWGNRGLSGMRVWIPSQTQP